MARIETDPNYSTPTFSRATAGTDLFKKEDVQALAAAVSTHVHDGVHGLAVAPAAGTIPGSALANGAVTLAKMAADSVDSSKIVNGSIVTADLADASVTNIKLASDTARANLLTNGGFEVWQRGNGPFATHGLFLADRWSTSIQGTDTLSISKDTTNVDAGSNAAAACTFVLGTGAGATSISQQIRPSDGNQLRSRASVSASVRVRTSVANAVRISVYSGTAWVYSNYHSGSGTYETLTVTTATAAATDPGTVGIWFAASCTAYIDNAMLVVGSVAADYAPLHPADDLARCLRYYERVEGSLGQTICLGQCWSTTGAVAWAPYKVTKAVAPTVTTTAANTFTVANATTSALAATAMSATAISVQGVMVNCTVASGLVAGNATMVGAAAGQTGSIIVEGNP